MHWFTLVYTENMSQIDKDNKVISNFWGFWINYFQQILIITFPEAFPRQILSNKSR